MPLLYILNIEVVGDLDLIQLAGVRPGDGGGKQDNEADLGSGGQLDDERCREDRGQDYAAVARILTVPSETFISERAKASGYFLGRFRNA